jgi:hypothetical protein
MNKMVHWVRTVKCVKGYSKFLSLRHLCKKTEIQYDQVIESLTHAKGLLKEKTVIKRLFMEVVKNQAGDYSLIND